MVFEFILSSECKNRALLFEMSPAYGETWKFVVVIPVVLRVPRTFVDFDPNPAFQVHLNVCVPNISEYFPINVMRSAYHILLTEY